MGVNGDGGSGICPSAIITSINTKVIAANDTTTVVIKGQYLSQFDSVTLTKTSGNGSIQINNFNYSNDLEISFDVVADAQLGTWDFLLNGSCEDELISDFEVKNLSVIVPEVITPPTTPNPLENEWQRSSASNNNAVLGTGTFQAQSGGNGWNEHGYFGGVTSLSQIDFMMDLTTLNIGGSAYCYVKLGQNTNPSTSGNPRLYLWNGANLRWYKNNGSYNQDYAVQEGDQIRVSLTPTSSKIFINGEEVESESGVYNLTNLFATFTAYRGLLAENIKLEVYN